MKFDFDGIMAKASKAFETASEVFRDLGEKAAPATPRQPVATKKPEDYGGADPNHVIEALKKQISALEAKVNSTCDVDTSDGQTLQMDQLNDFIIEQHINPINGVICRGCEVILCRTTPHRIHLTVTTPDGRFAQLVVRSDREVKIHIIHAGKEPKTP